MDTMTMAGARVNGTMDKDTILRRMQNLLNLAYLQAQPLEDGGYRISEKVFESIQTELDFNTPDESTKEKINNQIKKRYRQRNTYRFWKETLDMSNIPNDVDAKDFLLKIFHKLDATRSYGTMTHSRYALETMQLALDDTYGTNNTILEQHKFFQVNQQKKQKKANRAYKKSKPRAQTKKKTKKSTIPQQADVPF